MRKWLKIVVLCVLGLVAAAVGIAAWNLDEFVGTEGPRDRSIDVAEQQRVAVHEAGHAIVVAVLLGPQEIEEIEVRTEVHSGGHYGLCDTRDHNRMRTRRDILNEAAIFLGGRAADKLVNGAPTEGAGSDLGNVTEMVRRMHLSSGLGDSLLVRSWSEAPQAVRDAVERDINAANACAEAIVAANRDAVVDLATRLMGVPEDDGARTLSGDDFRAFLGDRALAAPPADGAKPPPCSF
jgi:ATP-dependent Zn protease